MFKNPFSFNGRIRRLEYGLSYMICIILFVISAFLSDSFTDAADTENLWLSIALTAIIIPVIWFIIAQGAKRAHDKGHSGWMQLIPFYRMWLIISEGDEGENEFGPNPKGIE